MHMGSTAGKDVTIVSAFGAATGAHDMLTTEIQQRNRERAMKKKNKRAKNDQRTKIITKKKEFICFFLFWLVGYNIFEYCVP